MAGAGPLRDRITIRRQQNIKNPATGGLVRSWSTVAEVWAEVRSMNAREAVIGTVLQDISAFQIRIRYRSDIKASDQVLWRERELNVHAAEDRDGKREWTFIHASTATPQGA